MPNKVTLTEGKWVSVCERLHNPGFSPNDTSATIILKSLRTAIDDPDRPVSKGGYDRASKQCNTLLVPLKHSQGPLRSSCTP